MSMMGMSVWSGLGAAPVFDRGTFFNPGSVHVVMVNRLLLKQSQKSGLGLIVETDILSSGATGEINPQNGQPYVPLPVGMSGTWWQGMTDRNVAQPAIKGFIFALFGLEGNDPRRAALEQVIPGSEMWPVNETRRPLAMIESLMFWATGEANILSGMFVNLDTKHIKTQKRQTDFTVHNWTPVSYEGSGLQPPDVNAIFNRCMTCPPSPAPQAPAGWGAPAVLPPPQQPPPGVQGWAPQGQNVFTPPPGVQGWAPQGQNVFTPPPGAPPQQPQAWGAPSPWGRR